MAPAHKKTLIAQIAPALIAISLTVAGAFLIPVHYPLQIDNGKFTPDKGKEGDRVEVSWRQEWRELCPITVTREFVGGEDGFKRTQAPVEFDPPEQKGQRYSHGTLVIPAGLPAGRAYYRAIIEPHCWVDKVWQRSYSTPNITLTIIK